MRQGPSCCTRKHQVTFPAVCQVRAVLEQVREDTPHSLVAYDILAPENHGWWKKHKVRGTRDTQGTFRSLASVAQYDIPILRINGRYWAKHRLDADEARRALDEAVAGTFEQRWIQSARP